jgi:hypothetical protein
MYSNPPAMFQRIGQFITHHEGAFRGHRASFWRRRDESSAWEIAWSHAGRMRSATPRDSASRRPRPVYAGKGAVPMLLD